MSKLKTEMSAGGAAGFQLPLGSKKKIEAFMEAVSLKESDRQLFFATVNESSAAQLVEKLDSGKMKEAALVLAQKIEEGILRSLIRTRLREVVRKKKGGGGFVLYSPNQGKKNPPKPVGDFPTKLQAKKAELQRFPPKDMVKLKRLRHEIDTLQKDPKKSKDKEAEWAGKKKDDASKVRDQKKAAKTKKESLQFVKSYVTKLMSEALFREEEDGSSRWDERMAKLSKAAIEADKKLQTLQKNIEKRSEGIITSAFQVIQKALKPRKMPTKSSGIKKDPTRQKSFLQFSVQIEGTDIGPFYVFVEGGKPKIEMSVDAKNALTRVQPESAKLLRAELITVQEDVLDNMSDVSDAVMKRDSYLDKLEGKVDGFVSGLNAMEISVLKNLLISKYRGK